MRKPIVGANWKMNLTAAEAAALTESLVRSLEPHLDTVDVVLFPAFPYLATVRQALGSSRILLGAQDAYFQPNGAFTGEVSLAMLKDLGVSTLLVGHSERRHVLGERDDLLNKKARAALDAGLDVIFCVGELLEQRESGQTDAINMGQTLLGLAGVRPDQLSKVTIAYEPVWAIGTGKTATPADAQSAHLRIRHAVQFGLLSGQQGQIAEQLRIQYGGSVKASNAQEIFHQPDVDGGLIGGASLKADELTAIVAAAARRKA